MESFYLAWRFVLDHPATPYLVPVPWHLLAVLIVLGLLAAAGLHHLLGYTYGFYRVPAGIAPWLALPSLAVLLVSVQVLLGIYLLTALAPDVARFALNAPAAKSSAAQIGNMLLSPAYGRQTAGEPEGGGINKAGLRRALYAYSQKELRDGFRKQLQAAQAQLEGASITAPEGASATAPQGAAASPELLLLALRWAAEDHEDWPPGTEEEAARALDSGGGGAGTAADAKPVLSLYILSLVAEIGGDLDMARTDWAHVAGNRFIQRVLGPLMVWQVRYLALMLLALLVAADLAAFFLLAQLKSAVRATRRQDPAGPGAARAPHTQP